MRFSVVRIVVVLASNFTHLGKMLKRLATPHLSLLQVLQIFHTAYMSFSHLPALLSVWPCHMPQNLVCYVVAHLEFKDGTEGS